jgi:hypothetical protein
MVLKPIVITGRIIAIKGNPHDRHNPVKLEVINRLDTLSIPWNIAWTSSDAVLKEVNPGDSLFKELGSLDLKIVKSSQEKIIYKFNCP